MSTHDTTPPQDTRAQDTRAQDMRAHDAGHGAGPTPPAHQQARTAASAEATGPRTGTVVGGLILVLLGLGVAAVGAGATLDLQAALIVLLIVAGAALLVGAALGSRRGKD